MWLLILLLLYNQGRPTNHKHLPATEKQILRTSLYTDRQREKECESLDQDHPNLEIKWNP